MKAVILAGGRGSRIAEESAVRPKPMVTVGGRPILWHIMQIYSAHGIRDFIICVGYKSYVIKEYFANYFLHNADNVMFDLATGAMEMGSSNAEPWRVRLVETGEDTQTGGRIKRILPFVKDDESFCLTYGDGVADVDITALIAHHQREARLATVTTVRPPGRFGVVTLKDGKVNQFVEKAEMGENVINGGFFVLSPKIGSYIAGDDTVWEHAPLQKLAAEGQLNAYEHRGFWQPMDTVREREMLDEYCAKGTPPWLKKPA